MNSKLLNKIRHMTEADLYMAVYQDPLTGALNRRAWREIGEHLPYVVLVDLDSLKFINDTCGYRTGDKYLLGVVEALQQISGKRVYRLAGDEFAIAGADLGRLIDQVLAVQAAFPVFSFGAGTCLDIADRALKDQKAQRERSGERAPRGEKPRWHCEESTE